MHPTPAAKAPAAPSKASPRARGDAVEDGAVLVVHADAALRHGVGQALRAAGFRTVAADGPEHALSLAPQDWTAAVLQLPTEDAEPTRALWRALRERAPALPVLQLANAASRHQPLAGAEVCLCEAAPPEAMAATLHGLVRAHRAEEQLRQHQADWRALQEQADLQAHALRNPLNAILMSAQVLSSMPLPPAARRAVDAICRNAQTQAHLISDTMQASRMPVHGGALRDDTPR